MIPSRLTLGTAQLGMPYGLSNSAGMPAEGKARQILESALELGVRSFDTAPAYGAAEARLGAVVRGRSDVFLTTKLPSLRRSGVTASSLEWHVRSAIETSLKLLGSIQIYLLHDAEDLTTFGEQLIEVLVAEAERAEIAHLGVSVYNPEAIEQLLLHSSFNAVQTPLNLLDQRSLTLFPKLRERNILTFVRSPFLQGLFSLDPAALPENVAHTEQWLTALVELTRRHGTTPMAAALPFLASIEGIDSVVLGVENSAQLHANKASFDRPLALDSQLRKDLKEQFSSVPRAVIDPSSWTTAPSVGSSEYE